MGVFGIAHLAQRTFLKLSSGEQRLCLLARAFVKDPELLILDEPLHGLDIPNRAKVKDIIQSTAGALWLTRWLSDGMVWVLDSWALRMAITLFFSTLVFAFLFKVLPNCRVRFRPAFWSGLVTALLFSSWFRICAVAQVGIAKSSALYGSFALLPIVLAWLYMSWQIVLLGCCMVRASFLHRQPETSGSAVRTVSHSGDNPEASK